MSVRGTGRGPRGAAPRGQPLRIAARPLAPAMPMPHSANGFLGAMAMGLASGQVCWIPCAPPPPPPLGSYGNLGRAAAGPPPPPGLNGAFALAPRFYGDYAPGPWS